jgi:transcriptional regulator with XRE-family HTH domain
MGEYMITQSNEVAKLMRERRRELKLSQRELSAAVGFSTKEGQFISNVERGKCQFPVKFINKLANALDVSNETVIELMTNDYRDAVKREVLNASELPNQANNQL